MNSPLSICYVHGQDDSRVKKRLRSIWEGFGRGSGIHRLKVAGYDIGEVSFNEWQSLALAYCIFHDTERPSLHLQVPYFNLFLKLPWRVQSEDLEDMLHKWGFSIHAGGSHRNIHLNWGDRVYIIDLPWHLHQSKAWYYDINNRWEPEKSEGKYHAVGIYDIQYVTDYGQVQKVKAFARLHRSQRRWICAPWLPLPGDTVTYVDVNVSEPIGEGVEDFHGGVYAWSFPMLHGETVHEALIRQMRARRFD